MGMREKLLSFYHLSRDGVKEQDSIWKQGDLLSF